MDTIVIRGGNPLHGKVAVSGAKNAALPLLAATLLAPGTHTLHNVPDLRDTRTMLSLLEILGADWQRSGSTVTVDTTRLETVEAPYELVKTMRASVLVLGPLIARSGFARVSLPGGCAIGARPINYHLHGFEKLGTVTELKQGYVEVRAQSGLKGATIYLDKPTVTGTENILMAAVCAKGKTVIKNAAREPEIGNLIDMLLSMGARIEGRDSHCLVIHGVERLCATTAVIIPDRIETGTYMIAVAAAGGEVEITDCRPKHLPALPEILGRCGVDIEVGENSFHVYCPATTGSNHCRLQSVDVTTLPYPGFATDLQAQFMALMTLATGTAVIHETIFENRFMHVAELERMGADIKIEAGSAVVRGVGRGGLSGAQVMATDLRASASLVIAGLAASGMTEIARIYHLERGYESMVEKLAGLGADIARVRPDSS
ncbi:MAG: UDP-N-acetylglucosamine 1-carboxyvinyltransferase [Desulfobulbus propionicus]|nr:MAG: UDP-N-acetylglucosamine 1-carboxyvinyltransferase [Desulfobulbus propionicus]